jgi:hypothetical protein
MKIFSESFRPFVPLHGPLNLRSFLEFVSSLSESPVRCFQLFSESYQADLTDDLLNTTQRRLALRGNALPPEALTAHIKPFTAHCLDPIIRQEPLHCSLFSWGHNVVSDISWEEGEIRPIFKPIPGPGVGVTITEYTAAYFAARHGGYTDRSRLYLHWPSILASAHENFQLYPPAVFLALAALPVVRTYSIVLYEYLFRQCAATIFFTLRDDGYFGNKEAVETPPIFNSLDAQPVAQDAAKALAGHYIHPNSQGIHQNLKLLEDVNGYMKEALGDAAGRLPRNCADVPVAIWDDRVCLSVAPVKLLERDDSWYPYYTPKKVGVEALVPLQPLTTTYMKSLWSYKTYIPLQEEIPQGANAVKPHRRGFLYNAGVNDYVTEFLLELGEVARMRGKESSLVSMRCWCLPPGIEATTLHDYFFAVNWQKAKKMLPYFFLQGFSYKVGEDNLSKELSDVAEDTLDLVLGEMVHRPLRTIPDDVAAALGTVSVEIAGNHCYSTYPMDQFRSHLLRTDNSDNPRRLLRKRYAKQTGFVRRLQIRMKKGKESSRLFKVVRREEQGHTATILVATKYVKQCRPVLSFAFLDSEYRCDERTFFQKPTWEEVTLKEGVEEVSAIWHKVPEEARQCLPYLVSFDLANSPAAPWRFNPAYKLFVPFLRTIRAYTTDQLYRWMMYDDANIKLSPGRRNKSDEIPAQDFRLATLVQNYLRPGMSAEDYQVLLTFSNAKDARADVATRASQARQKLFAAGEKDVSKFPLKQFDLRFRREYYQNYGISLGKNYVVPLPEDYKSIRELDILK